MDITYFRESKQSSLRLSIPFSPQTISTAIQRKAARSSFASPRRVESLISVPRFFGVTSTDGFIQAIRGQGSPLDAVVEGYLRESYSAAEAGLWLSSTFMLGAASERLLFIVAEHVDTLLKDSSESEKLARLWKVREVKEWIVNHLPALKRTYRDHKNAFTDVEDVFDTLFALYRYQRNEAGHPREVLPSLDPSQIRSMLLGFGTFQSRAYAILAVEP